MPHAFCRSRTGRPTASGVGPGACQGQALARPRGAGQDMQRGAGSAARRRAADGQRARRGQERRPVVGLVRDEDRRRVAARYRRARLPRAPRVRPRLRPGRAGHAFRTLGGGVDRRGVRPAVGGGRRALAGCGDRGRPGGVPRGAARTGAPGRWPTSGLVPVSVAGVEAGRLRRSRCARRGWAPGRAGGRCCFRRSTRSSGTGSASSASSTCVTGWRPTRRRRSGSTGTSPCRCSTAPALWVWSIWGVGARRSWPSRSRCSAAAGRYRPRGAGAGGCGLVGGLHVVCR